MFFVYHKLEQNLCKVLNEKIVVFKRSRLSLLSSLLSARLAHFVVCVRTFCALDTDILFLYMRILNLLTYVCMFGAVSTALPCQLSSVRQLSGTTLKALGQTVAQESARNSAILASANINDASEMKVSWRSPTGQQGELAREVMAGLVVALATIPTSISYSTIAGISPITGIWNSALVGLVITVVGGAPGK